MTPNTSLVLNGFEFPELFDLDGLNRLDRRFLQRLGEELPRVHTKLLAYREHADDLDALATSELLLAAAPVLELVVAELFGIDAELEASGQASREQNRVLAFKQEWVLKRGRRRQRKPLERSFAEVDARLSGRLAAAGLDEADREMALARHAEGLSGADEAGAAELEEWCALALTEADGQAAVAGWVSFAMPAKVDHAQLVPLESLADDPADRLQSPAGSLRRRDGFGLTDKRMSRREVQSEVDYCVYCHDHEGDFCSKGFPQKKSKPELGLKVNPLGEILTGCPLEEKISEMHQLKRDGRTIAALAMAMVDNPMLPATGHRICNDCMKACIYQKKEPVDIPQIETRVLTDVLALPWGVEIYDLLTRWNPLRHGQYLPKPYRGQKVLIAGMGPAGFTMAHHLSMEGCAVVGVDGLKIEPLPEGLLDTPVRDWHELEESLADRVLAGFGGVAEYGITVRWDKNFLKLIHLSLARRPRFQVFGGVRLGGTLTLEDAWAEGIDHVCIATGAGLPRVIPMQNSLARGMRQANDFLMALQLTGAAKQSSLANLQVRLPAVVIGGGLTAVDTATEVQAYYIEQVEKTLVRHETLVAAQGEDAVRGRLDPESLAVLDEFLAHGQAVRAERARAGAAGELPDFVPLLRGWGGVTIAYRRSLNESPAYLRNHEEVIQAMREGIYYAQGMDPVRAELDGYGHVESMVFRRRHRAGDGRWLDDYSEASLPARAVFVAAGASPNTIYENEHEGSFKLDGSNFLPHVSHADSLQPVQQAEHAKAEDFGPFTSYRDGRHHVSFLGDTHPVFHGSVVKAIASAMRSYPHVMKALDLCADGGGDAGDYPEFRSRMRDLLSATVARVNMDHPAVVELHIRAPMAARNFRPGQFFRLQTYERLSPMQSGTRLQIPVVTVSGTGVDGDTIRLMVLRFGPSPEIAARLEPGDPLVLMGPTGAPAQVPEGKTVLVVAGLWGAAVMMDLGPVLRAAGNRVLYIAAYGQADALYKQDELEAAADQIVWCTASGEPIPARREQDLSVQSGDVIDVIDRYGKGELGSAAMSNVDLGAVDEVLVMGSTGLLKGMRAALKADFGRHFRTGVRVTGTVGSPMQCMLKGVCGQCLNWQIDPDTGKRTRAVFSCSMQDQPLDWIDLDNLAARQSQNRLPEHMTGLWVRHLLEEATKPGAS